MDFTERMKSFADTFNSSSRNSIYSTESFSDVTKMSLDKLNRYYKSILRSPHEERIVFRPILAEKIMPKKPIPQLFSNQRYIMITNKRIYTLDPKKLEKGEIDKEQLIKNEIDIDYLSHLIFFPKDSQDAYDCQNQHWDVKKLAPGFDKRLASKKVEVIIGFMQKKQFKEKDIALSTNLLVVLQLIHTFHLAMNYEIHQDTLRDIQQRQKLLENQDSKEDGQEKFLIQAYNRQNRSSSIADRLSELPLFMVDQEKSSKQLELKLFYRSKNSPAECTIYNE